jgi:hypothetical protein
MKGFYKIIFLIMLTCNLIVGKTIVDFILLYSVELGAMSCTNYIQKRKVYYQNLHYFYCHDSMLPQYLVFFYLRLITFRMCLLTRFKKPCQ